MLHMIIEQTKNYKKRIKYDPETKTFNESESDSLSYVRGFLYPYGWIKESGTPPSPHWDVFLMSDKNFELGDEIEIKIIGVFIRSDKDHKMIAVEKNREINEYEELTAHEIEALHKLYPDVREAEGWFGRKKAMEVIETCEKPL